MGKAKSKGKKKKAENSYSGIDSHKRQKNVLVPPIMAIPGIALQSWVDDRLPEMLWAALLISRLGREPALERFREVAEVLEKLPPDERVVQPTLSGLAALEQGSLSEFLSVISGDTESKSALRPMLLFDDLPAKEDWARSIGQAATTDDWEALKMAVLSILDHQSQEATDCRWLRVLFQVLSGLLHFPTEEHVREITEYPLFGPPERVRPTIRAMEGMLDHSSQSASLWPQSFWKQCLRETACDGKHTMDAEWSPLITTTRRRIRDVREALARHAKLSLKTTQVDAKHDAVFGFGAYALALLDELSSLGNSTAILGRIGLRTLFESYVTLLHLKNRDDPTLWMTYRQYGSGQAKLAFLKLDDANSTAGLVNPETLRQLANEDRWLELVSIDLGHWAATDLRKLSDELGAKPEYDRFYPWTSAFTHSNWAAVRNSCFDLCINPLHRLHRVLRSDAANLGDVTADACELVDKILDMVDNLYPGFAGRVTLPEPKSASPDTGMPGESTRKLAPLATVQREFFQILDEFFRRATNCSAEDFAPLDSFGERIREQAQKVNRQTPQAYMYVHQALGVFYERFGPHLFSEAQSLGGLKLILGGTSSFGKSQLESVRSMLLYADSILIPDPILPWIESLRGEERFRHVRLLEDTFFLLRLKPLADADLSRPPIVVVPSFEKSLEERDPKTQIRISTMVTRVLSHFLGRRLETLEELQEFVTTQEREFMRKVEEQNLFVAPGGHVGQPLQEALMLYEEEVKHWRSDSYQTAMKGLPKGMILLYAIMERLAPHYHLLENADELSSCPLIALPAPWHYYTMIADFFAAQLQEGGQLNADAAAAFGLIKEAPEKWLGGVPLAHMHELLSNRENEGFRARLRGLLSELRQAPINDLDRITPVVCRGIASLLKEHDSDIHAIQEKYESRYGQARVSNYITRGATYMPTLAPTVRIPDPSEPTASQSGPANSCLGAWSPHEAS